MVNRLVMVPLGRLVESDPDQLVDAGDDIGDSGVGAQPDHGRQEAHFDNIGTARCTREPPRPDRGCRGLCAALAGVAGDGGDAGLGRHGPRARVARPAGDAAYGEDADIAHDPGIGRQTFIIANRPPASRTPLSGGTGQSRAF